MRLSSPIHALKRRAKRLSRYNGIKLHEAVDQIATKEGFKDWVHLVLSSAKATPAKKS